MICIEELSIRSGNFQMIAISLEFSCDEYGVLMLKTDSGSSLRDYPAGSFHGCSPEAKRRSNSSIQLKQSAKPSTTLCAPRSSIWAVAFSRIG